ncbi:MAG: S9 family peptidase [Acidobacteriaceae bacterium]|nr:S9 family peptidase [Acidobacteriaceae bacterium]
MFRNVARYFWTVFACVSLHAQSARDHRLTLEDLVSVEPMGETTLSPDGKTIAAVRAGQIVLFSSDGGWPVTLTSSPAGKSGVSWSPDSRTLAFVSQGSIWTVSASGGQPHRLTRSLPGEGDPRQAGDRSPRWSPKGDWILFETGRRGHGDVAVVSPDGLSENILSHGNADAGESAWSPDETQIAYTERAPEYFSGRLVIANFDAHAGHADKPRILYTARVDRGGSWSLRQPSWSPDSRELALSLQESGWENVYLIPATGGTPKPLTRGEQEDRDPVFSPDGKAIAFVSNRGSLEESHIWIAPVDGSSVRALAHFDVPGIESAPEWSPDGSAIYFHRTTPLESTDLLLANLQNKSEPKYLSQTTPKNFDGTLQVPERVRFQSKDGLSINAMLYKPRSLQSGVRCPAVLWIHGGPEGQDGYRLDLWAQYLAQQGYLVLEPNYRGSTGYGEKFRNFNVEDSGGGEMDDVAAGAQYLVDQGLADPKRLAIGGGSHGGTMTAYAVTKYPQLFAAAIEMYGVVDRATFVERTNRNSAVRWMMKMGGTPAEKPEVYRRANSLLLVDKIQTPLLVMHGEDDPQVPPYESAQFTKALAEHHKTYYYFTYPNELHGFSQRQHRLDAWSKELVFLQKYIQPKFGLSSTSTDALLLNGPTRVTGERTGATDAK